MSRRTVTDALRRALSLALTTLLACSVLVACASEEGGDTVYKGQEGAVVVSLGDSYSSGEGVEPFYDQDEVDKVDSQDWLAHRSTKSWPGKLRVSDGTVLLSDNKADLDAPVTDPDKAAWYFLASSGAVTSDILTDDQDKEVGLDSVSGYHTIASGPLNGTVYEGRTIDNQLRGLKTVVSASGGVDYVTMTIGGNDVGFTSVVESCILSNQFSDFRGVYNALEEAERKYDETARENIRRVYTEVSRVAGPDAHVLVAGYPTLLDSQGSHLVFHKNEALAINNRVEWFNAQLEQLVREVNAENDGSRGQVVFVSVQDEFRGHEAYTDDAYINKVMLGPQSEDLRDVMASAYSVHPNNAGTDAYARCVQEAINQIEGGGASEAPVTQPSGSDMADEKDVALVLDVSGSMDGRPIEETKSAAGQFVDIAADNGAECALVTYANEAEVLSGFSSDAVSLRSTILDLSSAGGTNIEDGLRQAAELLDGRPEADQYIVLMSDGEPTAGLSGDELIAYAESIRDPDGDGYEDVRIYALGFDEGAGGQDLLRGIASDGCFFSVQDPEDLEGFFTDIVDAINGVRFMYVRVACPVDVEVTYDGETLSSAGDEPLTRTSFGSLTFEEEVEEDEGASGDGSDDLVKVLRLREGASYDIAISGYDTGTMDYRIGFVDDGGHYADFRTFDGINVTDRTRVSTTAEVSDATTMRIDDDGDGVVDRTLRATANGSGQPVDNTAVVVSVLAVYGVALVLLLSLLARSAFRRA